MAEARDEFDRLRCPYYPKCKTVISAMTGLQELQKLQKHLNGPKHRRGGDMNDALELRASFESRDRTSPKT